MKLICYVSIHSLIEIPAACHRQIALGAIDFMYKTSICRIIVGFKFLLGSTVG